MKWWEGPPGRMGQLGVEFGSEGRATGKSGRPSGRASKASDGARAEGNGAQQMMHPQHPHTLPSSSPERALNPRRFFGASSAGGGTERTERCTTVAWGGGEDGSGCVMGNDHSAEGQGMVVASSRRGSVVYGRTVIVRNVRLCQGRSIGEHGDPVDGR